MISICSCFKAYSILCHPNVQDHSVDFLHWFCGVQYEQKCTAKKKIFNVDKKDPMLKDRHDVMGDILHHFPFNTVVVCGLFVLFLRQFLQTLLSYSFGVYLVRLRKALQCLRDTKSSKS